MKKYIILGALVFLSVTVAFNLKQKKDKDFQFPGILNDIKNRPAGEAPEDVLEEVVLEYEVTNPEAAFLRSAEKDPDKRFRIFKSKVTKGGVATGNAFVTCQDEVLNVRFLCDQDWKLEENGETFFLVISEEPGVTMTFAKVSQKVFSIYQMNKPVLDGLNLYSEGYGTEMTEIAGLQALKVKGYSKELPNIRLSDYYFVHDGTLYSLMFSVDPKEAWDDFQFFINKVVESFEFI